RYPAQCPAFLNPEGDAGRRGDNRLNACHRSYFAFEMFSVAHGAAVLARLGAAVEHVRLRVEENALVAAAVGRDARNLVSPPAQLFHDRVREAAFGPHAPAVRPARTARRRRGADVFQTRRLAGLLDVHAEVDQVNQYLDLALRLHVTAHDAETEPRSTIPGHERGDDRVERTLVRLQAIEMLRIEREQRAAILQGEAEPARHQSRTETEIVALDQRHTVAVLVDHREIDGITAAELGVARRDIGPRFLWI